MIRFLTRESECKREREKERERERQREKMCAVDQFGSQKDALRLGNGTAHQALLHVPKSLGEHALVPAEQAAARQLGGGPEGESNGNLKTKVDIARVSLNDFACRNPEAVQGLDANAYRGTPLVRNRPPLLGPT
jgi:hypothetical protein